MGRSEVEIEIFKISFYVLQVFRLGVLAYYTIQTRRYILLSERTQIDLLTKLTFAFLGLYILF